ncbi:chorismate synthase [Flexistipes sinusarabici DSM 4947]|uniref:Chorismate synthase n=1 Tax=Flexistipes sinusarabici (strain ATCC 49648 / DSM 4947 / MAS 10) TaxID=717231 RepID=F8E4Q2_FLESM|nr:chorismate synthase [Flexistipes sinusarabici]AEI15610.1 chorismate synthase [Flexistipes sinusarabici DSM 4947]
MSGNSFGKIFRITTFGESHGPAVGVVLDGCPAGLELHEDDIQKELDRRRPGQSEITTPRDEADKVEILSGVFEGKTTGTPVCMVVYNKNQQSKDYGDVKNLFRPGHADYTYFMKYGIRDYRGGGRSSSRETIGRVAAGAVAKKLLSLKDIKITGYVKQIGTVKGEKFDEDFIERNPVRCADSEKYQEMKNYILKAKDRGDSVGGIVEVIIRGVEPGLGEPVFDRLNADLAKAILSLPAVKGIEFGRGFDVVYACGSENNDEISPHGFLSNNAGGTLGGISTGQDIVFRFPVKPASSILIPKQTIDKFGNSREVVTKGRHDPCVAPRVVPVAEAMASLVIVDSLMINKNKKISDFS